MVDFLPMYMSKLCLSVWNIALCDLVFELWNERGLWTLSVSLTHSLLLARHHCIHLFVQRVCVNISLCGKTITAKFSGRDFTMTFCFVFFGHGIVSSFFFHCEFYCSRPSTDTRDKKNAMMQIHKCARFPVCTFCWTHMMALIPPLQRPRQRRLWRAMKALQEGRVSLHAVHHLHVTQNSSTNTSAGFKTTS